MSSYPLLEVRSFPSTKSFLLPTFLLFYSPPTRMNKLFCLHFYKNCAYKNCIFQKHVIMQENSKRGWYYLHTRPLFATQTQSFCLCNQPSFDQQLLHFLFQNMGGGSYFCLGFPFFPIFFFVCPPSPNQIKNNKRPQPKIKTKQTETLHLRKLITLCARIL